jgi:hypothetical protein
MTPQLPERVRGLSTQGKVTSLTTSSGLSSIPTTMKLGQGSPSFCNRLRIVCLLLAARTEAMEFDVSPKAFEMVEAKTAV